MARALALLLTALAVACYGGPPGEPEVDPVPIAGPESHEAPAAAAEAETIELRLDEPRSHGDLELRWSKLDDSRCPQGVQCVWEGEATVTLEVSAGETPRSVELRLRPGAEAAAIAVAGHELRLLAVTPHPKAGVTPERRAYVATVEIGSGVE